MTKLTDTTTLKRNTETTLKGNTEAEQNPKKTEWLKIFMFYNLIKSTGESWMLPGQQATQMPKKKKMDGYSGRQQQETYITSASDYPLCSPVISLSPAGDDGAAETMAAAHILVCSWLC